jgi:hypothetical protein
MAPLQWAILFDVVVETSKVSVHGTFYMVI